MPKDEDVSIIHMDSKHLIKESAIRLPFGDRRTGLLYHGSLSMSVTGFGSELG